MEAFLSMIGETAVFWDEASLTTRWSCARRGSSIGLSVKRRGVAWWALFSLWRAIAACGRKRSQLALFLLFKARAVPDWEHLAWSCTHFADGRPVVLLGEQATRRLGWPRAHTTVVEDAAVLEHL